MRAVLIAIATTLSAVAIGAPSAAASPPPECVIDSSGGTFGGTQGTVTTGTCAPVGSQGPSATSTVRTQVIDCGLVSSQDNGLWDKRCGAPKVCFDPVTDPQHKRPEHTYATLVESAGRWVLQSVWCPASAQPVPTTQALREQVLRLLPHVPIGSAWTTRALVNAQAIVWAATPPDRSLGTVTVVGRRVALRIGFDHASWDFGEGTTDSVTEPGKPYDRANPCATAQCPGYYGHTYRDTGKVTITLNVAWHAQFSLDNGTTWTDVDTVPLTGPRTSHDLQIVQARGILVPPPGR